DLGHSHMGSQDSRKGLPGARWVAYVLPQRRVVVELGRPGRVELARPAGEDDHADLVVITERAEDRTELPVQVGGATGQRVRRDDRDGRYLTVLLEAAGLVLLRHRATPPRPGRRAYSAAH